MAEVKPTPIFNSRNDVRAVKWTALGESDTAVPLRNVAPRTDATVLVIVNAGSGVDVRIRGTLDEAEAAGNFVDLHDPQGNVITFTASDIATVLENVPTMQPAVAAGTGVDVDVYLMLE